MGDNVFWIDNSESETMSKIIARVARKRIQVRKVVSDNDIGAPPRVKLNLRGLGRGVIVEASQAAALSDPIFRGHVLAADEYRDSKNWALAAKAYMSALTLYPYQNGYWVQHGHMLKEQGLYEEAEISYRTASAYGALPSDVNEHVSFVMQQQGIDASRYPIRYFKASLSADQVPGRYDVELLASLVWQTDRISEPEIVNLLRVSATCDALLAAMVADQRFERANRDWLSVIREGDL